MYVVASSDGVKSPIREDGRFLVGSMRFAANDDTAFGEIDLLANLVLQVPPCPVNGRRDKLGTDVSFAE
jgi:hypothetical protein